MNDNDNTNDMTDDQTVPAHSMPHVSSGTYGQGDPLIRSGMLMPPINPGALGTIGKYQVVRILGEGGMGQVLLAREPVTVSLVAIKMIKPEFLNKGWSVHRFLTEARHMFRMSHPSIIRVLDVSDRPQGPYFVMPYMAGGSLADKIKPGEPLPSHTILPIARAVAEALHHAHTHGITHRDLKPSNILLDGEGKALLADFGLLRTFHNDTIIDAGQPQIEGTVPYMSPAVAAGKAEDTRCDIYSFGCLLYEMLTGQPPYQGPTADAVLQQIQDAPPPPIRQLNPHAPANLVTIADHAMARELRDRYATMGDVVAELERVAQGKDSCGPHGKVAAAPNKWKFLAAAGVVILIALAMLGISQSDRKHDDELHVLASPVPLHKYLTVDLGDGVTMEFVLIRPGSFTMGSDKEAHKVTHTKSYYIGKYEVTQEQWEKIMGGNPSMFKRAKCPVENVSWADCQNFVKKLNENVPGKSFRLPTEAEWEYACRAGSTGDYCYRTGEGALAEYAWYRSNAIETTHPVGEKKPNAWGLYDMHGNVWEWCSDWYASVSADAVVDPHGSSSGSTRVSRGGSWNSSADRCRSALRGPWPPSGANYYDNGLRIAFSSTADDAEPDVNTQYNYTTENGTVTITKYTGPGGDVVIPDKINGLPVTCIGDSAFNGCTQLTTVKIPNSIIYIGSFAFYGCTGLSTVTIPGSVTGFHRHSAFAMCTGLLSILVESDNPVYTSVDGVLFNKEMTNLLSCPAGKAGNYAIPNGVTTVKGGAFFGCTSLTNVKMPSSVTILAAWSFSGCSRLNSIVVDEANPAFSSNSEGVVFNKGQTELVRFPSGKAGNYEIPANVIQIGGESFQGSLGLASLTIPDSVISIRYDAFNSCPNLVNVYFKGNAPNGGSDASIFADTNNATIYYLPTATGWGKEFGGRPTAVWEEKAR